MLGEFSLKGALQVAAGLHIANIGDFFNIVLMAFFAKTLLRHPEALALVPSLAAMRGAIVTSMASRVSTALHLGTLKPSNIIILKREFPILLSLALLTSTYAAIIVGITAGYDLYREIGIGALSGLLSIVFLAPTSVSIATLGYRRGLDPDRYMAPILTVIGDISTSPTIVAVVLLLDKLSEGGSILLALTLAYASLSSIIVLARGLPGRARVLAESITALVIVGLFEAYAGGSLVKYSRLFVAIGILHAIPSIMEDVGAAASVVASRLSTLSHLYGLTGSIKKIPAVILEVVVGSISPLLTLSFIAFITGSIAGFTPEMGVLATVICIGGLASILVFSLVSLALVHASIVTGADPDNVVIPILTSIVDALSIPLLALIATTIYM